MPVSLDVSSEYRGSYCRAILVLFVRRILLVVGWKPPSEEVKDFLCVFFDDFGPVLAEKFLLLEDNDSLCLKLNQKPLVHLILDQILDSQMPFVHVILSQKLTQQTLCRCLLCEQICVHVLLSSASVFVLCRSLHSVPVLFVSILVLCADLFFAS